MIRCALQSVGIAAPGLSGWAASLPVLRGQSPHVISAEPPYAPALLPPNERRRATATVRQAFRAAEDAITPVADSEKMHDAIAGSRLVVIENAGHVSNLERTEQFNHALQDFLKELPN